ncbi:hypothetical protein GH733_018012 [Mirounga leonina]|nr:hypothetical protein GH733_018012 [Mirounga leonina]
MCLHSMPASSSHLAGVFKWLLSCDGSSPTWGSGHAEGRRPTICLGPQLGHLETFPRLRPCLGEAIQEWCAGWGQGFGIDSSLLVKTAELDPSGNYLFSFHPHGVLVTGAFSNFCAEATGFSNYIMCSGEKWGDPPVPAVSPPTSLGWGGGSSWSQLYLPGTLPPLFSKTQASGPPLPSPQLWCPLTRPAAACLLFRPGGGRVAVLDSGGPLEALEAKAGELILWIRNQKGFVALAREQGGRAGRSRATLARRSVARRRNPESGAPRLSPRASLVPCFLFRGNELLQQFPNPPGSRLRSAREALQPLLSVALPLFPGPLGLLLPFRTPVHTRSPRPSRAQVDALHALSRSCSSSARRATASRPTRTPSSPGRAAPALPVPAAAVGGGD